MLGMLLQVAADDELSSVKQAMAIMSKQHYLDMKRLRDSATGAAAAQTDHSHSIMSMVDSHGNIGQKGSASSHKQLQQQQQQQRSMEAVAAGSKSTQTQQGIVAAAAAADGEDISSPLPAYKLQIQIHQLERQVSEQVAKTQEEIDKQQAQV